MSAVVERCLAEPQAPPHRVSPGFSALVTWTLPLHRAPTGEEEVAATGVAATANNANTPAGVTSE
jgi:hypothetical protein